MFLWSPTSCPNRVQRAKHGPKKGRPRRNPPIHGDRWNRRPEHGPCLPRVRGTERSKISGRSTTEQILRFPVEQDAKRWPAGSDLATVVSGDAGDQKTPKRPTLPVTILRQSGVSDHFAASLDDLARRCARSLRRSASYRCTHRRGLIERDHVGKLAAASVACHQETFEYPSCVSVLARVRVGGLALAFLSSCATIRAPRTAPTAQGAQLSPPSQCKYLSRYRVVAVTSNDAIALLQRRAEEMGGNYVQLGPQEVVQRNEPTFAMPGALGRFGGVGMATRPVTEVARLGKIYACPKRAL